MSRGSPIVPIRFTEETLSSMRQLIERRNAVSRLEPWSMSDFVRSAVAEKIAHMARARKPRGKRQLPG